jgi:hypothetical protein
MMAMKVGNLKVHGNRCIKVPAFYIDLTDAVRGPDPLALTIQNA